MSSVLLYSTTHARYKDLTTNLLQGATHNNFEITFLEVF